MVSGNIELLEKKHKRNILLASKKGSINVNSISQYMDIDVNDAEEIISRIHSDGFLDRKNNPLPGGGYFYTYDINSSGLDWLRSNIARKYKVLIVVNNSGPVSPKSVSEVVGSSLSYASNTLRRLWAEGLISRKFNGKHAYLYSVNRNGVDRVNWILGKN